MYIRKMEALLNGRSMGTKYGCDLWGHAVPTIKLKNNHLFNVLRVQSLFSTIFLSLPCKTRLFPVYKSSAGPNQLADEAS